LLKALDNKMDVLELQEAELIEMRQQLEELKAQRHRMEKMLLLMEQKLAVEQEVGQNVSE
jgi:hypothetical protein